MITNTEDFLMSILKCGQYDLALIANVEYDWSDIIEQLDLDISSIDDLNLNKIMSKVFFYGINSLDTAVNNRIDYLRDTREMYGISAVQKKELDRIKNLDPFEDIAEFHNYIDTHIWFENNENIYRKYFNDEIDKIEKGIGFKFESKSEG